MPGPHPVRRPRPGSAIRLSDRTMSRRLSFAARRRRQLTVKLDLQDILLETRNTITEPISLTAMSLGIAPALVALGLPRGLSSTVPARGPRPAPGQDVHDAGPVKVPSRPPIDLDAALPIRIVPMPAGGGGAPADQAAAAAARANAAHDDGDWLTLSPASDASATGSGLSTPWHPAARAGGGQALPPRGGSGNGAQDATIALVRGQITPLRLPAPQ